MLIADLPCLEEVSAHDLTAGSVSLEINALAYATGDSTYTATNTTAKVKSVGKVYLGFGLGSAYAYGDSGHYTDVWYAADGFNIVNAREFHRRGSNDSSSHLRFIGVRTPRAN